MSNVVLALMLACGMAVPVSVLLSRTETAPALADVDPESTPHEDGDCPHCADLAIPPGLTGRVSVPRQRGEQA
ncbi:hypothetical protein [Streptomyces sp. NBC_01233]|uniref:hypothetical protein n=1 Tax=Streptomyces sp. NBC_01233 TaxID=2903787 RepID=UPI002E0E245A|nr:hypothetical protein OG332_24370 [Streptomyces sp. NBC_01233]